jgi:H+/gluconate symporter-like permease
MSSYVNSLLFMGVGVTVGVGVVVTLRPPRAVLVAAAAAGLATALADFVCAALGHHYDLWHLHGALTVVGVPLSLTVAWVTLTAALVVMYDRFAGLVPRLVLLALAALGGASVDHYVLRPSQMLTWGRIPPAAITPYWLSMVGLAVGVYYLALRLQPRRDEVA